MNNNLKNELIKFFKNGIKSRNQKLIGLEIEHFIVDRKTYKSVNYYGINGIKYVLKTLINFYPNSKPIVDEDIVGFVQKNFTVTLEPSAQIEISICPYENLETIKQIYENFLTNINSILEPLEYKIIALSCIPVSNINSISTIPKRRYKIMEEYFNSIGTRGIEMMKGTCSTQVSIDFFSEDDFRKKIQVAYFLTPIFKLISNNANYFQSKKINNFLKRSEIWSHTDSKRCDIPPNIFSQNYGFENYAEYLSKVPLIFYSKNNQIIKTGNKTVNEIFKNQSINNYDILHIISMVFPDVRLKKYLEIRCADCMPFEYVLGYCALIKGIFYSDAALDVLINTIKKYNLNNNTIELIQDDLIKHGWKSKIYDLSAKDFAKQIVELSKVSLNKNEIKYLNSIVEIIDHEGILNINNSNI